MSNYIVTSMFCLWATMLAPGFLYQGQSGSQPRSIAPESSAPRQAVVTTEPIILETPAGKLFGSLEAPKSSAPPPVALIIAGSGPTDRNGNSPGIQGANNSLKYLAEGLAAQGVSSVRYDKRGVAESIKAATRQSDLRFETYIDDAVLWGKQLRADKRFSSVIIIGHSEGSLIGMVAAQKMNADAFISVAGAGRPAPQGLLDQLKRNLPADLQSQAEMIIKSLSEGKIVEDVPPALVPLFPRSIQPYIISYFKYDPAKEIAKLSIPILITQGTTDIQVPAQDAKLLAEAKPTASLLMIEGMNHMLKEVPAEQEKQLKSYTDPSLPVAPKLIDGMSSFIKSIKK
ncbi:MAG TPA: alpha/beta hydrolase [Blastocatellia bacterium]|jgi:pimeloyl-ACP methyl ester carboxylesterase|nr:alpha/beta hydrolase [Blastocatellia bacterium]